MEDGLVQSIAILMAYSLIRLNPCCNGRWSRTLLSHCKLIFKHVLILVVMEDGLVLVFIRLY